jgi:glycosyltransferase involved in cell wall biosynthesis
MKVLLANKFFYRRGGAEVVFLDERRFLLEEGISVLDFAMQDEQNLETAYSTYFVSKKSYREKAGPIATLRAGLSLIHSFEAVSKFRALLDAERPDIVHFHNIYHQLTPSIISAAKSRGIPVVLTLHDFKPVCPTYLRLRHGAVCSECVDGDFFQVVRHRCAEGSLARSALLYAEATFQRLAGNYEKVDLFIAPSEFLAAGVSARFPRERIRVLPNGVDTARITRSDRDDGYVLYVGRISHEKGIRTLLEAHRRSGRAFTLKICGTGPLLDELQRTYPDATFLGYRTGDELAAIIAGASLVVVPSECYENCPMAVLEAMGYGKPVVASNIGGIPELVIDGENGLLFQTGNADHLAGKIAELAGDPNVRHRFGRRGRERVEQRYSLIHHNEQLLAIYRGLMRPPPKA